MCFNCKSKGSLNQTVAAKKTVPRIFFKKRQNLPDTFLLQLRKKKMGVTVLVFALRTKVSPTVIDTVAELSQIRRSHTIRFSTTPLHPMDWPWRSLLNSEPWTRSIAIRFRFSRGSLSIDVTTGSSYLKEEVKGIIESNNLGAGSVATIQTLGQGTKIKWTSLLRRGTCKDYRGSGSEQVSGYKGQRGKGKEGKKDTFRSSERNLP